MWILNAHVPISLVSPDLFSVAHPASGLVKIHLKVDVLPACAEQVQGYTAIYLADGEPHPLANRDIGHETIIDQRGGLLLPCFVDVHTHLDKGHIWSRSPNPSGTFADAMQITPQDAQHHWTEEDLYARMDFALRCSYAHGTQALRTHLDSSGIVGQRVWKVFRQIQTDWSDRLGLQGVALVPPQFYQSEEAPALVDLVAESQGILGGVYVSSPGLDSDLDRLFQIARDRGLALDLHVDESSNRHDRALFQIAQAKLRHGFESSVICGHCCSLSLQSEAHLAATIALVKAAKIGIVSLPLCNLYLQDRQPHRTPQWRGITAIHELKQAGVPIALASDNCRDPFYAFGDHDGLEVLRESTRIAHLDHPFGDWIQAITRTPAEWLGMDAYTRIEIGFPAEFILFQGRNWNEVLSRPENDRRVFRKGQEISTRLPAYSELWG